MHSLSKHYFVVFKVANKHIEKQNFISVRSHVASLSLAMWRVTASVYNACCVV